MEIGLLTCDQVAKRWVNTHTDYPDMFQAWLPEFKIKTYRVFKGEYPENVDDHPVWMATGSRYSAYDDQDWIHWTKDFIRIIDDASSIFIGVCFGHQLLGDALGGQVKKSGQGWQVGVQTFQINQHLPWMIPNQDNVNVLMMCQDQVIKLPPESSRIASYPQCENAMFLVKDRLLGIQGHPEFTKEYTQVLMESRTNRIGGDQVQNGINSLKKSLDQSVWAGWVGSFIRSHLS